MAMTRLLFVRQPHVYLPEIPAYQDYLARYYPSVQTFESTKLENPDPLDFDIVWHFMGMDRAAKGRYVVHEYNSLSTQPFSTLKDFVKRTVNAKPHQRVFLNKTVQSAFRFKDDIPSYCRDMGVDRAFFDATPSKNTKYDLVYAGGLNRGPIIKQFLDHFSSNVKEATLLLVGDAPQKLQDNFKDAPNIIFHGRVPYEEIPILLSNARYGLNIMPDIFPFNIQTATKVLEYAAIGLPIITTDYQWVRRFEDEYKGKCFKLNSDMSNLSLEALSRFDFKTPNIENMGWDEVIHGSGLFSFLDNQDFLS